MKNNERTNVLWRGAPRNVNVCSSVSPFSLYFVFYSTLLQSAGPLVVPVCCIIDSPPFPFPFPEHSLNQNMKCRVVLGT